MLKIHTPIPKYMLLAIREAAKNLKKMDGGPFGACIVKNNRVLATARNQVLKKDATCHAEVSAIRKASRKSGKYDLSGSVIYSTTEPCPMCFSAIHWARIGTVVYGTNISDVKKLGFNELCISNEKMKRLGKSKIRTVKGFLRNECKKLLQDWSRAPGRKVY
jgi:guanine deaminase